MPREPAPAGDPVFCVSDLLPHLAAKQNERKLSEGLKGEYDSVSDEMGSIYYKGFSAEEITRFEECLDRIRKNLEEWQKS